MGAEAPLEFIEEAGKTKAVFDPENAPSWSQVRAAVNKLAIKRGEWAGYPQPIDGLELVIEPRHPLYGSLNGLRLDADKREPLDVSEHKLTEREFKRVLAALPDEINSRLSFLGQSIAELRKNLNELGVAPMLVNAWHCHQRGINVFVYRLGKRAQVLFEPASTPGCRFDMQFNTLLATDAWDMEAELQAQATLAKLISDSAYRRYILCGMFLERSQRSGVYYLFRKLRPTLAVRLRGNDARLLSALCLHPVGYYMNSFAGTLVPTDDVIAHLLMMRGDERKFWAKANQHPLDLPQSGL